MAKSKTLGEKIHNKFERHCAYWERDRLPGNASGSFKTIVRRKITKGAILENIGSD